MSIDKNLDIISKHKSNIDSLQRLETKKEGIEREINSLEVNINKFCKESKIPYQIITL